MTIPVVRKRAKKPKVRTGCKTCRQRHIKCGEERPGCRRCLIAGRECGGYDVLPPNHCGSQAVLLPKGNRVASVDLPVLYSICRGPALVPRDMTEHEVFAFDHFRLETVRQLPGNSWTLSWERLALQMGHHAPAVTHAAIALGSIHRALSSTEGEGRGYQHEFALSQYNKAMGFARRHIEKLDEGCPDEDVEVVLLVSLLFFCFEVLHSEDVRATMHLHTGLRILYERIRKASRPALEAAEDGKERRQVLMPTIPKNNMDVLVQTFVRLDSDLTIVGEEEPYLTPVCRETLPTSFYSLEEAMVHLDALAAKTHDLCRDIVFLADKYLSQRRADYHFFDDDLKSCLACAYSRTMKIDDRPDLIARMEEVKQDLNTWMTALANVSTTDQQQSAQILTQIHFFYYWFVVATWRDKTEMAIDRFDSQFEHILSQAEEYVDLHWRCSTTPSQERKIVRQQNARTRQAFTLGTDLVPCIAMIALKCRTSAVRRRCVELLRAINLQGVFDNYFLASFVEEIWYTEERFARDLTGKPEGEDFLCHEVPNEARMVEIEMSPMQYKHNFYKADSGRMVFAALDTEGELQPHERIFHVERPEGTTGAGHEHGHACRREGEQWVEEWINKEKGNNEDRPTLSTLLRSVYPSPSPSSSDENSTSSATPTTNAYTDSTHAVRRVRGHMPCCCNRSHADDTSSLALLMDSHMQEEPRQGFFATFYGVAGLTARGMAEDFSFMEGVDDGWLGDFGSGFGERGLEVAI